MNEFLLKRPIAVVMSFLALFILGIVSYQGLPVSLLPNIDIPHMSVQLNAPNSSARELETAVMAPLRRQLLQVGGLKDLQSRSRDGKGTIELFFDYGVNTDLAFIEVNEKIDASLNILPKDLDRPKVIKENASDIPVLYLNLSLKTQEAFAPNNEPRFLKLCDLAVNVIKKRIEQLPELAIADISGVPSKQVQIVPDWNKMKMAGFGSTDIEQALLLNSVDPGAMLVRDGQYEYNINLSKQLRNVEDIADIYLNNEGRLLQLRDLAELRLVSGSERGPCFYEGKPAVCMALIKQSSESMDQLKASLATIGKEMEQLYPDLDFSYSRNQTELLDYSIANLQSNLLLGLFLILIIAVFFMGDIRSPFIIGLSMICSIVISFALFYLFNISLNVISLSGLIFGVGMMIDSSIVVSENIDQYRLRGYPLMEACSKGATEMISPMLSSSLTTVAVFIPLIFLSGVTGAIFSDQAFAIASSLFISYVSAILLLPVLYYLVYRRKLKPRFWSRTLERLRESKQAERLYDRGINWVFAHKKLCLLGVALTLPLMLLSFQFIRKELMPPIEQNELMLRMEWNEQIHLQENARRVNELLKAISPLLQEQAAYVGAQDFLVNSSTDLSNTESELYLKVKSPTDLLPLQSKIEQYFAQEYPQAQLAFAPPVNIFEKIFDTREPELVAELSSKGATHLSVEQLHSLQQSIDAKTGIRSGAIATRKQMELHVDWQKLALYGIDYADLKRVLQSKFKDQRLSSLQSAGEYIPITIAAEEAQLDDVLKNAALPLRNKDASLRGELPLSELIDLRSSSDLKEIHANAQGEYTAIAYEQVAKPELLMQQVEQGASEHPESKVSFTGAFFSNQLLMRELSFIFLLSLLLMYFILCAQFESFTQPILVLLEIPIDTSFAILLLWLLGYSLNLMAAIGIIVSCGIVINDSILKIDSINTLRKQGLPLIEAIHSAGRRRLRAIIMTSLTTIIAVVPILFGGDMGSQLQRPLALAMIATMSLGTLVSLFIVPLLYWSLTYRAERKRLKTNS